MHRDPSQQIDLKKKFRQAIGVETPVIAVASGKGGVGKSTLTVQLALALKAKGKKVAILDADVYGPSLPSLLQTQGADPRRPQLEAESSPPLLLKPIEKYGFWSLSIGHLVPPETSIAWRAPMVIKALKQLLFQTDWPQVDVFLIDMPPGTGDVHLTLAQSAPLTGAFVISTPHSLSLADVTKAVDLFAKIKVPVHGFIENMGTYTCPHCTQTSHPFGTSSVEKLADSQKATGLLSLSHKHNLPILAQITLLPLVHKLNEGALSLEEFEREVSQEHLQVFSPVIDAIFKKLSR